MKMSKRWICQLLASLFLIAASVAIPDVTALAEEATNMSLTIEIHDAKVEVTEDGEVWIDGSKVGEITSDGEIWVGGEKEGSITDDNEIWKAGERVGEVTKDGDVWRDGNEVGNVTDDGTIWIDGSREGSFKGKSARYVAAIVFFDFFSFE